MKQLFYGGTILTMEKEMQVQALLTENGKILETGPEAVLRAHAPGCSEVNLHGAVLMPGFIDAHSHFFQTAASLLQVSLNGASDPAEIAERIGVFIRENNVKPGQWIAARDYDNNRMPDLKNPTMEALNRFAPENPLVIHHKSGHMGLMNEAALKAVGIGPDTPAPEGGRIETADGRLTGYLEENAFFEAIKKIPMAGPDQMEMAFLAAQKKYASYGITTIQDGMVVEQMLPMYRMLLEKQQLYLDVIVYSSPDTYEKTGRLLAEYPDNIHLQSGGMKIFLDGSPQGRTAWMRKPYAGESDYCGYGTMTDEAVEAAFRQAARAHTQLIAHCNGDGAAAQFLRCLRRAEEAYPQLKKLRPVLIHGQLLGTDQIPEAAELGAVISFFVAHIYHWGDVHIRNFGMERASLISPARTALDAGIPITFHQDTPVIEPDMMETVWCAVSRTTEQGVQLSQQEKITVPEALRAITIHGARQYFQEDQKGSLVPGKAADLVILDQNPMEAENLREIRVLKTYKNGCCIYSRQ